MFNRNYKKVTRIRCQIFVFSTEPKEDIPIMAISSSDRTTERNGAVYSLWYNPEEEKVSFQIEVFAFFFFFPAGDDLAMQYKWNFFD